MKEMIDGYGAIDVSAFPSVHKDKCVQCHMPPTTTSPTGGNHTFKIIEPEVANEASPNPIVTTTPTPRMPYSSCSGAKGCHTRPNEPYGLYLQDTIEQRQDWTHGQDRRDLGRARQGSRQPRLRRRRRGPRPLSWPSRPNQWTTAERAFLSSFTNVEFVESEGSFGLHNWDYSREIVNVAMSQAKIAQTGVVVRMPWVVTLKHVQVEREGRHHRQVHGPRHRPARASMELVRSGSCGGSAAPGRYGSEGNLNSSGNYSISQKLTRTGTFRIRAFMPANSHEPQRVQLAESPAERAPLRPSDSRPSGLGSDAAKGGPREGAALRLSGPGRGAAPALVRPPGRTPSPTLVTVPEVADSASETANSLPNPTLRSRKRIDCRARAFRSPRYFIWASRAREHGSHVSGGTRHALRGDTQTEVTTPALRPSHHPAPPCLTFVAAPSASGSRRPGRRPGRTTVKESTHMAECVPNRKLIAELMEKEEKRLENETPEVLRALPARHQAHAHGRRLHVPRARPVPDLLHPRQGPAHLERRGQGDRRLPQRLRLHGPGARPSAHRRGHPEARAARHPVRSADRGRHHHGREPRRRLQAPAVALRQLGLRGHDGRHPRRPRLHRPRDHRQDVRLVPRPSRLRHGQHRRARLRQDRPARQLRLAPLRRRHPAGLAST